MYKGIDYLLIADSIEKGRQIILEERRDIDGVFLGPPLDIVFETIGLKGKEENDGYGENDLAKRGFREKWYTQALVREIKNETEYLERKVIKRWLATENTPG